jgi:hypothetical protein
MPRFPAVGNFELRLSFAFGSAATATGAGSIRDVRDSSQSLNFHGFIRKKLKYYYRNETKEYIIIGQSMKNVNKIGAVKLTES